eukprot:783526_1
MCHFTLNRSFSNWFWPSPCIHGRLDAISRMEPFKSTIGAHDRMDVEISMSNQPKITCMDNIYIVYPNLRNECWVEAPLEILYRTWRYSKQLEEAISEVCTSATGNDIWKCIRDCFDQRKRNILLTEKELEHHKHRIVGCVANELGNRINIDTANFVSDFFDALCMRNGKDLFGVSRRICEKCDQRNVVDKLYMDDFTFCNVVESFMKTQNNNISSQYFQAAVNRHYRNKATKTTCDAHLMANGYRRIDCSIRTRKIIKFKPLLIFYEDQNRNTPHKYLIKYPKRLSLQNNVYELVGKVLSKPGHFFGICKIQDKQSIWRTLSFDSIGHGKYNKISTDAQRDPLLQTHTNVACAIYILTNAQNA